MTRVVTYNVSNVYNAFSGSSRIPANAMIMEFKIIKYVPIGLSFMRDNIIATISIPLVEAPIVNVKPTPIPPSTPPNTALSIISSEKEINGRSSRNKVVNITEMILYTVKPFPTFNQPKIATGMLNKASNIPVLIPIPTKSWKKLEVSWANPVKPLAYTLAPIRKKFKDIAFNNAPNITPAIRFASIRNIRYLLFLHNLHYNPFNENKFHILSFN